MAPAQPDPAHDRPGRRAHPAGGGAADLAAPPRALPPRPGQGRLRPRRQHDRGPAGHPGRDRQRRPGTPLARPARLGRVRRAPRRAVVGRAPRRVRPRCLPHVRDLRRRAGAGVDHGHGLPGEERGRPGGAGSHLLAGEGPVRRRLRGADLARLPAAQPVRRAFPDLGRAGVLLDLRPAAPGEPQRQRPGDDRDLRGRPPAGGGAPAHRAPLGRHRIARGVEPLRGAGARLPGQRRPRTGEPDRHRPGWTSGVDGRSVRTGGRPARHRRLPRRHRGPAPSSTLS